VFLQKGLPYAGPFLQNVIYNRRKKWYVYGMKRGKNCKNTLFDRFGMEQRLLINVKGVK